jgi:tRNA-intron endonuclease
MAKIKAILIGETITSNTKSAQELYSTQRFGEKSGEKINYSLSEALFLIENKKADIYNHQNKKLTQKQVLSRFQKIDQKFKIKYAVFKNLRSRGYVLKTALKFGAEFRVYKKGSSPVQDHAKWILYPVSETETLTWHDFAGKNRVAHSTKKNLLIAVVDQEQDVSYYEVDWIKP